MNNPPLATATEPSPTSAATPESAGAQESLRKRGGRGYLVFVFILALLGGGYYAYEKTPLKAPMQKIAGWLYHLSDKKPTAKTKVSPAPTSAPAVTADKTAKPLPVLIPKPLPKNLSAATDNAVQEALAQLRETVARLQLSQHAADAQLQKLGATAAAPDHNIRLSLIDLRLQLSGDTAAASSSLAALGDTGAIDRQWLATEVIRLQHMPNRNKIARIIQKLLAAANNRPPAATTTGTAAGIFTSLFNVRKVSADTAADNRPLLRRLEVLLLTGQRQAYLLVLNDFAARNQSADSNIELQISLLQKFGAPVYAINYGTLQ